MKIITMLCLIVIMLVKALNFILPAPPKTKSKMKNFGFFCNFRAKILDKMGGGGGMLEL